MDSESVLVSADTSRVISSMTGSEGVGLVGLGSVGVGSAGMDGLGKGALCHLVWHLVEDASTCCFEDIFWDDYSKENKSV